MTPEGRSAATREGVTEPGLVVVDKPGGLTSHDVVGRCRRLFGTRKVGHAGTLDPMATGVLVIGIERATKILGLLTATDKSYFATIRLGQTTSTEDAEGEVLQSVSAAAVTESQLESAIAPLRGGIDQIPSAVSAIKVDGKRAYQLVRDGQTVELKPRRVRIDRFEVREVRREVGLPGVVDVDVDVDCTSGTYIRALARDVGAALGVGGHLTALRRTRVGALGSSRPAPWSSWPMIRRCRARWTRRVCRRFRAATSPRTRRSMSATAGRCSRRVSTGCTPQRRRTAG